MWIGSIATPKPSPSDRNQSELERYICISVHPGRLKPHRFTLKTLLYPIAITHRGLPHYLPPRCSPLNPLRPTPSVNPVNRFNRPIARASSRLTLPPLRSTRTRPSSSNSSKTALSLSRMSSAPKRQRDTFKPLMNGWKASNSGTRGTISRRGGSRTYPSMESKSLAKVTVDGGEGSFF